MPFYAIVAVTSDGRLLLQGCMGQADNERGYGLN
jgi:hypothetical protein